MRFHVISLPHTQTSPRHEACAFTTKVYRFLRLMSSLGHEVFHYGAEGSEVSDRCIEHINVISAKEQEHYFGTWDKNKLYSLDWSGQAEYWKLVNDRATVEINKRKQPTDFLCLIASGLNDSVVKATGLMPVEYGIGYDGPTYPFRVYESYSHLHRVHGGQKFVEDGSFYEAVIPNYYPENEFPLQIEKGDYYLYLGRLITRKGINIAVQTCQAIGAKLVVAGQGVIKQEGDTITCDDGAVYKGVQYVGCVTGEEKTRLLGHAKAIFVPTVYMEPLGGTAVEAQLCGTPAITTDFGAFTETVEHGKTGYRCHTLDQFVWAAKNVSQLDSRYIRQRAVANYSMDRVRHQYHEYFSMLADLFVGGWPTLHDRKQLDWLRRY